MGEEIGPEVADEAGEEDQGLAAPSSETQGTLRNGGTADEEHRNSGDDEGEKFFLSAHVAAIRHELGGEKVLDGAKDEGEEALGDDGHRIRTGLRR